MDSRIFDLLDQWTEAKREGRGIKMEDLCGVCPELQDELIKKIKALEKMDWLDAPNVSEVVSFESQPTTIGRYEVKSLIGRGGQGEVWKALDPKLNRIVAIKIPRYGRLFHGDSFLNEARKVARLKHPGIVPVFDVGDDRGRFFIVSEFIPGGNLAENIRQSAFSHRTAALLVADVADALDYAHAQGYVHRDIKPENILMDDDGKPQITDFGIALSEDQPVRERLATAGTQAYMSPEQVDPESQVTVDHRSDIYAVGVLLYQLLTGRLPFVDTNQIDLWASIISASPRTPRTIDRSISIELERICLKALSKRSSDRYSTAGDLAAEIRMAVRERKPRRWPLLAGVFSVITIGSLTGA